jgi:hypothetical protein
MSDTTRTGRGLVAKLAEVMAAVERVPKRGRNEFHRYDYATEADIVSTVRDELSKRGVMLIPSVQNHERHEVTTKKNERGDPLTVLHMTFTFVDGETGERETHPWLGVGQDGGDKGVYKAMTGAAKYFLMKTFLMPTGDDPETEGKREARKAERAADSEAKAQQRADVKAATVISADERRTLGDMAKASGWPIAEVKRLLAAHGFAASSEVTKDKYPLIVDAMKHGGEVPHTPQVGVKAPENALVV